MRPEPLLHRGKTQPRGPAWKYVLFELRHTCATREHLASALVDGFVASAGEREHHNAAAHRIPTPGQPPHPNRPGMIGASFTRVRPAV
ncbi:hypothetical protein [Micromonospora sp. LOL_023]|uniref:hypothetical protein n=1 Tax=Micromonospora sp. LOL_023 TaxID=3345418 RepID=UPI003A837D12